MSEIHRFTGQPSEDVFSWENVETKIYNTEDVKGVIKNVLVGPQDGAPNFIIRFFQVPVGESTFNHAHPHEHGIVILHGKARVNIEDKSFDISISSYVAHGLKADERKTMYDEMSRITKDLVIFYDYNEKRAALTDIVEWLEGGDYFNFIKVVQTEMKEYFGDVRVIDVTKRGALYVCELDE